MTDYIQSATANELVKIINNFPDGVYILDKLGRVVYANNSVKKITGYAKKDILGKNFAVLGLLSKEQLKPALQMFKQSIAGKKTGPAEYVFNRRGMKPITVEVKTYPLKIKGKQYSLGAVRDITQRKEALDKLKKAKQQAERYLNIAGTMIVASDKAGKIILINKKAEEVLGYKEKELLGQNWFSTCLPKGAATEVKRVFQKIMTGQVKSVTGYTNPVLCKDGSERLVEWFNTEVRDDQGKIIGLLSSGLDVTEKVRYQQALEENKKKFRILFLNMKNGFAYHKIITNNKGQAIDYIFEDVNEAFEEMTGLKKELIVGKKITEILPGIEQDPARWIERYGKVALTGQAIKFEDYSEPLKRWFSINAYSPKKGYFATVIEDITARKRTEKKIRNLDILKTRFITALTHVTRTPLNEIRWGLESILAGDLGEVTKGQSAFLRKTLEAQEQLTDLITNMNFVLDIERETVTLNKTRTSLRSLVKSVVKSRATEAEMKEIKLTVIEPAEKVKPVNIDVNKIKAVMEILLQNALNYSPKGKEVMIEIKLIKDGFKVSVTDQGIGVPAGEQEEIFERFYRASSAQSLNPNGVGLGLYIAKSFVEAHGGQINFKSEEGAGSTFWFELPFKNNKK